MGPPRSTKKYYSVAKGRNIGIFTEWSSCEISINRYPHAVHKGFEKLEDAINFLIVRGGVHVMLVNPSI